MRISEFGPFYERCLQKHKTVLVKGKPGTGKTIEKIRCCRATGFEYIGICSPTQSPVKIGGYPRAPIVEGGDATHALFDGIARAFRATQPTLLNFSDLGMANGETLKAIVDLVQFGTIDTRHLPDCVLIGADTNDVGHGAGVEGMIEPLKSKFHTIVELENHIDDIIPYGLAKGWPTDLLAYLRNNPDALHDWKPTKSIMNDGACPRGWEYVAEWIRDGFEQPEVIAGAVGRGRATAYLAFRQLANELPDVDAIMLDPENAPVPDNPSARYMVSMALASRLNGNTFGQIVKYLNRMPQVFRAFTIRDAMKAEGARTRANSLPQGYKPIHSSRDFTAWVSTRDGAAVTSASGL